MVGESGHTRTSFIFKPGPPWAGHIEIRAVSINVPRFMGGSTTSDSHFPRK